MAGPTGLYDLLSVHLILLEVCSNLSPRSLLRLSSTSQSFHSLVHDSPGVFSHLDLSHRRTPKIEALHDGTIPWTAEKLAGSVAEDDRYTDPFRHLVACLRKKNVLSQVQTLVLDNQPVAFDTLREVLWDPSIPLKILSVVGSTGIRMTDFYNLLYDVCHQIPKEKRRLRGVYVFGTDHPSVTAPLDKLSPTCGVTSSLGATLGESSSGSGETLPSKGSQNQWYLNSGTLLGPRKRSWPPFLLLDLHFDAVLCRGPKHTTEPDEDSPEEGPSTAMVAIRGCQICHKVPEGFVDPSTAPSRDLPLLAPALRSPSIKWAQQPPCDKPGENPPHFLARCFTCLAGRWCGRCGRFWCEDCWNPATREATTADTPDGPKRKTSFKVYSGLCIEHCLVTEMYHGAGSGGMWG